MDSIKPTLPDGGPQAQGTPPDPREGPDPEQPLFEMGRVMKSDKGQGNSKNYLDSSEIPASELSAMEIDRVQKQRISDLEDTLKQTKASLIQSAKKISAHICTTI